MTQPPEVIRLPGVRLARLVELRPDADAPYPVYCPAPHRIHTNGRTFAGHGHLTCTYSPGRGARACNAVMLVSSGLAGDEGKRWRLEIHVQYREIEFLERHHVATLTAMLAYLRVPWPARILNPDVAVV